MEIQNKTPARKRKTHVGFNLVPLPLQQEDHERKSTWFLILFLLGFSFKLVFVSRVTVTICFCAVPIRACFLFSFYFSVLTVDWWMRNKKVEEKFKLYFVTSAVRGRELGTLFLFSRLTFPLFFFLFHFPRFLTLVVCVCCSFLQYS